MTLGIIELKIYDFVNTYHTKNFSSKNDNRMLLQGIAIFCFSVEELIKVNLFQGHLIKLLQTFTINAVMLLTK